MTRYLAAATGTHHVPMLVHVSYQRWYRHPTNVDTDVKPSKGAIACRYQRYY